MDFFAPSLKNLKMLIQRNLPRVKKCKKKVTKIVLFTIQILIKMHETSSSCFVCLFILFILFPLFISSVHHLVSVALYVTMFQTLQVRGLLFKWQHRLPLQFLNLFIKRRKTVIMSPCQTVFTFVLRNCRNTMQIYVIAHEIHSIF